MTPEKMLEVLSRVGEDAGADFDDAEDVQGWFGWSFKTVNGMNEKDRGMLTIWFIPAEQDEPGRRVQRRFWVMPA